MSYYQQNHTTSLEKSDVDSYLQLFHVHYYKPTNESFWYADFIAGNVGLVEKHVMNHLELAPIEWQTSNRLHIAAGCRHWMHWIWQDTVCMYIILSWLMHGTMRQTEILRVETQRLRYTMSLFSSSSKFRFCVGSALRFTLGEEPYSHRYWTQMNTNNVDTRDSWSRISLPIFSSSSGATVAKPVHKMNVCEFPRESGMCKFTSYRKLLTDWATCTICYLRTTGWGGSGHEGGPGHEDAPGRVRTCSSRQANYLAPLKTDIL